MGENTHHRLSETGMVMPGTLRSNFAILGRYDEQLLRLGMLAERYFPEDPNTTLLKLRQLTEIPLHVKIDVVLIFGGPDAIQPGIQRIYSEKDVAA